MQASSSSVCTRSACGSAQRVGLVPPPHHTACGTVNGPAPQRCSATTRLGHERDAHQGHCRVSTVARAVKRQLERDFAFGEVYESVLEKLRDRKYLSVRETYQLIECIKSPEQVRSCGGRLGFLCVVAKQGASAAAPPLQPSTSTSTMLCPFIGLDPLSTALQAARCLDLIAGFIAARSASIAQGELADPAALAPGDSDPSATQASAAEADQAAFQADWPHRKRFLARIAEIAVLELQRPELVYAIINNWQRFRLRCACSRLLRWRAATGRGWPLADGRHARRQPGPTFGVRRAHSHCPCPPW